jgi:EAL domain-containing protein (putative c-di-GMP-specific phosphodiesterase class I)
MTRSSAPPFPFTMAFQPIVDVRAEKIFAYEALARGPRGEPAADVLAQVDEENRFAFEQHTRTIAIALAGQLGIVQTGARLSINFVPGSIVSDVACLKPTLDVSQAYGVPLDRLIFEITEVEEVRSLPHLPAIFEEYRRRGFGIAIDDFGSGYSGLNLLADFPADIIKLDMALIRNVDRRPAALAIVGQMVKLAKSLGSHLIAEGVETVEEYVALRSSGVYLMQGYLLGRPAFEALPDFSLPAIRRNSKSPLGFRTNPVLENEVRTA